MSASLDHTIDIRHYWRVIWRRKWLVLLATLVTVCASLISLTFMPKEYESSAVLYIQDRQPLVRELEQVLGGGRVGGDFRAENSRTAQIVSFVKSRPFLERVIKILRMHEDKGLLAAAREQQEDYPGLTAEEIVIRMLVNGLQSRVQIATAGPGLYRFIVRDYNPQNAQLLARWVSELFIDLTLQKEMDQLRQARKFGEDQLRVYQDQLRASEQALQRYQGELIQGTLVSTLVRRENLLQAESLQKRLADDAATADARTGPFARAVVDAGYAADDALLRSDPEVLARLNQVKAALGRVTEEELATPASAIAVRAARTNVSTARTELYQELENQAQIYYPSMTPEGARALATYVFSRIDADLQRETAQTLAVEVSRAKRVQTSRPTDDLEVSRLEDEVRRNRELLDSFKKQIQSSDISQAIETTSLGMRIEIYDPAALPFAPSWPNTQRILTLALLMGPLLGIGFAFLAELLDPTLRVLADIQRVAPEPVLGTIPLLDDVLPVQGGFRRYWLPVTLISVVLVTAGFFVAKATILPNLGEHSGASIAVEPAEGIQN